MIRRLWGAAADRLATREAGTSLALFRIFSALSLLSIVAGLVYSGSGVLLVDVDHGGPDDLHTGSWLLKAIGGTTPAGIGRAVAGCSASGLLLALGFGGRLTALVTLQLTIALFAANPGAGGGHDRLLTNALWLLVLAPSTATLSLDCRLRTGRWTCAQPVAAWARYLAVYQLVLVYFATGTQKLGVEWMPWGGFSAVYRALLTPSWRRFDMDWVAWVYPATQALTALTLVFEIGAPVWLLAAWYRATRARPGRLRALSNRLDLRALWALVGVGMHLGIWIFMNVGPFSPVTLSYYAALWHPDEWAALARRIRGAARASKTLGPA